GTHARASADPAIRPGSAAAMARPTARRSALRSESHMSSALTPNESTSRTASFRARIRVAPGSTPSAGRSMFLRIALAALLRFLLGALGCDPVLADEPAPEIDGPTPRRPEREGR